MSLSESGKDPFQCDFSGEITTLKVMEKIKEIINLPVVSSAPVISRANVVMASTPARQSSDSDDEELPDNVTLSAPLPLQSNDYTEIASSGNLVNAPGFLSIGHSLFQIGDILNGKPSGTYLIRFSTSDVNKSALSFVNNQGQLRHTSTNRNGDVIYEERTYNICKTADVQSFLRANFLSCEGIICRPYNASV